MRYLIITALALALGGCNNKRNPQAAAPASPPPARVPLLTVETRPFAATVAVTGTLVSRATVDVKAETTGRVLRFPKREGEFVRASEELIWVDDENYKLDVRHAKSAVQVAEAALERAKVMASHAATHSMSR